MMEYKGVSQPRSLTEPSEMDVSHTCQLLEAVQQLEAYEGEHSLKQRESILQELDSLVKSWVASVQKEKAGHCGSRVLAFGGYSLGIVSKGGDVDAVAIVPSSVDREDFFITFLGMLQCHSDIINIRAIEGAYVPVIKFLFHGVEVDLCLSCLPWDELPNDLDLSDMTLLKDMDILSARSINGIRECAVLKSQIPNEEVFLDALRVIKVWAKAQGIHSSAFGFLGGISWAIMVARICQLYPNAAASTVVSMFFTTFMHWEWPQPVILKELSDKDPYQLQPWNPKLNPSDSKHQMPVITPAYPEHNAAFTVCDSTLHVMTQCFSQASKLIQQILQGQRGWGELFTREDLLHKYRHYLMVIARAHNQEDLLNWSGLVESKLRHLVQAVEKQDIVSYVHPCTTQYEPAQNRSNTLSTCWFLGLQFCKTASVSLSLGPDIQQFDKLVKDMALQRKLYKQGMTIQVQHVKRKQIAEFIKGS